MASNRWKDDLTGPGRSAAAALIDMFRQWGLESLASKIVGYIKEGYDSDTVYNLLQDSNEWKKRFVGNEYRQKAGLSVLSPAEYIATERGYMQALRSQGLPAGYYDKPNDFAKWMASDVSPDEVLERAKKAREVVDRTDSQQRSALARYGIAAGDIMAAYLDPKVAKPILDKKVEVALLDAERKRAGFSYSRNQAELLYDRGISVDQAREGYSAIAQTLPTLSDLGQIEGVRYGLEEAQKDVFSQDVEAARTRQRLVSNEVGRFSGGSGQSGSTLSSDNTFR